MPMLRLRARLLVLAALVACDPAVQPATASSRPPPAPAPLAPAPAPAPAPPAPASEAPPAAPVRQLAGIEYIELLTGDAEPDQELPLILAIHGLGDRPERFASLLADLSIPARVIIPRGLDPAEGGGHSWFAIRARSNDLAGLSAGIANAGDRLIVFVRELTAARPTRGKAVVTGFSQGGMLSFYLATHAPELFAAAYPVGGWLPSPLWPRGKLPSEPPIIFALHGAVDNAVKLGPTADAVEHLRALGWPAKLRAWPEVGHAIPPAMRQELHQRIEGALRTP